MKTEKHTFQKIASLLLGFLLLIFLSLSSSLVHIDHECTGDDCPLCEIIFCAKLNLQNLHFTPEVFIQVQQCFLGSFLLILPLIFTVSLTPVSTKIRLNN